MEHRKEGVEEPVFIEVDDSKINNATTDDDFLKDVARDILKNPANKITAITSDSKGNVIITACRNSWLAKSL